MRSFASYHDIGGTYFLAPWGEVADPGHEILTGFDAHGVLADWSSCPLRGKGLCDALDELRTALSGDREGSLAGESAIDLVREGRACVVRMPWRAIRLPEELAPVETKAPDAPVEEVVHWIQVVVVDEDDQPVADVAVELVLPDESVVQARTTKFGAIYLPAIPKGKCTLSLPELDGKAWTRVG